MMSKRDKIFNKLIGYFPIGTFLINVILIMLLVNNDWFYNNYNFAYDTIGTLLRSSTFMSLFFILITYRYRLCKYNQIASWALLIESLLNLYAINFIHPDDHLAFVTVYANFLLFPTALIALEWLIIEERKPKPKT